jgi:hypothetical protein
MNNSKQLLDYAFSLDSDLLTEKIHNMSLELNENNTLLSQIDQNIKNGSSIITKITQIKKLLKDINTLYSQSPLFSKYVSNNSESNEKRGEKDLFHSFILGEDDRYSEFNFTTLDRAVQVLKRDHTNKASLNESIKSKLNDIKSFKDHRQSFELQAQNALKAVYTDEDIDKLTQKRDSNAIPNDNLSTVTKESTRFKNIETVYQNKDNISRVTTDTQLKKPGYNIYFNDGETKFLSKASLSNPNNSKQRELNNLLSSIAVTDSLKNGLAGQAKKNANIVGLNSFTVFKQNYLDYRSENFKNDSIPSDEVIDKYHQIVLSLVSCKTYEEGNLFFYFSNYYRIRN